MNGFLRSICGNTDFDGLGVPGRLLMEYYYNGMKYAQNVI